MGKHLDNRGATMLEFAIVCPLVFFLVCMFIDLAHYFTAVALLQKGAADGAKLAITLSELGEDLSEFPSSDPRYVSFNTGRNDVIDQATSLALDILVGLPNSGARLELVPATVTDAVASGSGAHSGLLAMVVRPGETWTINSPEGDSTFTHPIASIPAGVSMREVLKTQPVIVQINAVKRFFIPLIWDSWPIQVSSVGWLHYHPKSALENSSLFSPTPTPSPSSTYCPNPSTCSPIAWDPVTCSCTRDCPVPPTVNHVCQHGGTWNSSRDRCECDCPSDLTACPYGYKAWEGCSCQSCQRPTDGSCDPPARWNSGPRPADCFCDRTAVGS